MNGPARLVSGWRVWNMNYRLTDAGWSRMVKHADLAKPWIAESSTIYQFFATHAEALEYVDQQTGKSAA